MNTENTIASRVRSHPRICTIRTEAEMIRQAKAMTSLQLWSAMFTKGVAGWRHKIMSDEFERRRRNFKHQSGLFKYEM